MQYVRTCSIMQQILLHIVLENLLQNVALLDKAVIIYYIIT